MMDCCGAHKKFSEHCAECRYVRALEARTRALEAALGLARTAMCAPFDDWKGVLERRALDAARAALTEPTPPQEERNV